MKKIVERNAEGRIVAIHGNDGPPPWLVTLIQTASQALQSASRAVPVEDLRLHASARNLWAKIVPMIPARLAGGPIDIKWPAANISDNDFRDMFELVGAAARADGAFWARMRCGNIRVLGMRGTSAEPAVSVLIEAPAPPPPPAVQRVEIQGLAELLPILRRGPDPVETVTTVEKAVTLDGQGRAIATHETHRTARLEPAVPSAAEVTDAGESLDSAEPAVEPRPEQKTILDACLATARRLGAILPPDLAVRWVRPARRARSGRTTRFSDGRILVTLNAHLTDAHQLREVIYHELAHARDLAADPTMAPTELEQRAAAFAEFAMAPAVGA